MFVAWLLLGQTGAAGPPQPAPAPITEIEVVPSVIEGQVRLVYAGREGDQVYVDEWNAGALPIETQLAGGLHTFRVEGSRGGKVTVNKVVEIVPGQTVTIDLKPAPAPAPGPATPPPAPATSPPSPPASAPPPLE